MSDCNCHLYIKYVSGTFVCPHHGTVKGEKRESANSYYFVLDLTGVEAIDEILRLVARAGKASHSTEFWNDDVWETGEPTWIEKIQAAADEAARQWREVIDE